MRKDRRTGNIPLVVVALILFSVIAAIIIAPGSASAKTAAELNEEVSAAKAEYNELVLQQEQLQSQIDDCTRRSEELGAEIAELQGKVGRFAKEMYKGGDWLSVINVLFSSESLDNLLATVDAITFYMQDWDRDVKQLKDDQAEALDLKTASEVAKSELDVKVEETEAKVVEVQEAYEAAKAAEASARSSSGSGSVTFSQPNGGGLTRQSGVNYYNGRKETYYSSRVLYHYRTPEWNLDSEGFWRTSEGYYVVAASDMSQGTTFEGSKGTCQVLDSGCAAGTTDYYVGW